MIPLQFQLKDTDPMPFGKYKGEQMSDVPASYLHYLWVNGKKQEKNVDPIADYINRSLPAPKQEWGDGIW